MSKQSAPKQEPKEVNFNQWVDDDPEGYRSFLLIALMNLEAHGMYTPEECELDDDGAMSIPASNWVNEWLRNNPTMTAEEAKELVKEYLDTIPYNLQAIGEITFTQTFAIPGGSITVGGTVKCNIKTQGEVKAAYSYLRGLALRGYNDFLRDEKARGATAQSLQQSKTQSTTNGQAASDGEWMPFVRLVKGVNQRTGNVEFRVFGGKYNQFGVALYPECIDAHPGHRERFDALDFGSHQFSGQYKVWVKDGKPVRVTDYKFDAK